MIEAFKTYILDILSVLLPGALLMAILGQLDHLKTILLRIFPPGNADWINAVYYTGLAYMLGHFIFFIGSYLDNWIFENVKRVFWNDHRLVALILKYKEEKTGITDSRILNAFKWSCAWLLANQATMYSVVERHVAESKFFRSLVVVLVIALAVFISNKELIESSIIILLIILSLIRYLTQRQKSIVVAYEYIITSAPKVFDLAPDETIIADLNKKNIDPCNESKSSLRADDKTKFMNIIFCNIKKILVILNLCLNPFYKRRNQYVQEQGNKVVL